MLPRMRTPDPTRAPVQRTAQILRQARESRGLSLRSLGKRAGTSHSTLIAYEKGQKVPSVATFMRILDACGFAVDIQLSPRIRERDGFARGKELEQVLELAAQFPARHRPRLDYPKFARQ